MAVGPGGCARKPDVLIKGLIHKSFTHYLRRFLYWNCYLERALEWLLPREMGLGVWTRRLTRVLASICAWRGKDKEWTHAETHRHPSHAAGTCGCWPWAAHEAEICRAANGSAPGSEPGIAQPSLGPAQGCLCMAAAGCDWARDPPDTGLPSLLGLWGTELPWHSRLGAGNPSELGWAGLDRAGLGWARLGWLGRARLELILFTVAGLGLCFWFALDAGLKIQKCFCYCWAGLRAKAFSAFCTATMRWRMGLGDRWHSLIKGVLQMIWHHIQYIKSWEEGGRGRYLEWECLSSRVTVTCDEALLFCEGWTPASPWAAVN